MKSGLFAPACGARSVNAMIECFLKINMASKYRRERFGAHPLALIREQNWPDNISQRVLI